MQLAFVGLGAMGSAIAHNLLASGHALHVFNRHAAKAEPLRAAGATVATSPAEAARAADVVFTMVADDAALKAVTFGEQGIAAGLRPDAVHVCMSTIGVAAARELARQHASAGQHYVSAPVFGRPDAAAARKLHVMAAGADADLQKILPLLREVGQSANAVGPDPWQANLVKLIGNMLLVSMVETLGEACAMAEKTGVSPAKVVELLTGTLFTAPPYQAYGAAIAAKRFQPAGFALPLAQKDIRLMLAAGEEAGVALPIASLVRDRFLAARAAGADANHDLAALALVALSEAGLKDR
jgi:3-hydroxyisobutyrate dehydrogenase-like beta-hydroxyacid dehydrogenase